MNTYLKKKWVAALRSGEYEQGKRGLKNNNRFCCLGVLCDIINPAGWAPDGGNAFKWVDEHYEGHSALHLTCGLRDDLGLSSKDENALIRMNDEKDYSFEDIADWIEENL